MLDFYYMLYSAPCRSVLMTALALGLDLNKKQVDLDAGEHLKPEFIKINPQHTIPTLVDGDFVIWESRAIMMYLAEKYAKDDSLYPKDPQQRAVVNHRLFFDLGTLYQSYVDYYFPQLFEDVKKPADPEKKKKIDAAFNILNTLLEDQQYAALNKLTLADFTLLATVSTFEITGYDFGKYPNVVRWYDNAKKVIPGWEENWVGCEYYKKLYLGDLQDKPATRDSKKAFICCRPSQFSSHPGVTFLALAYHLTTLDGNIGHGELVSGHVVLSLQEGVQEPEGGIDFLEVLFGARLSGAEKGIVVLGKGIGQSAHVEVQALVNHGLLLGILGEEGVILARSRSPNSVQCCLSFGTVYIARFQQIKLKMADFYYLPGSAPCRSVIMTAKAVGVELNKKLLNLQAGEQLKPEFLKINPQHTIPTLVDNGFALWESRAILVYLVEKYGKTDSLYPKCPKKRAVINQRLYFDMGTLYQSFANYYYPQVFAKAPADPEAFKKIEAAFEFLNTFLEGQEYAAGDSLTVADIALVASVSTFEVAGFEISKYANVNKWYENAKKVTPGWEENWAGCLEFKKFFE
ncbi:uncharacterized protein LOC108141556 [Drosophila elegans]|nr:uncharacterized protein LOC108141556 [Drosophila elegans]